MLSFQVIDKKASLGKTNRKDRQKAQESAHTCGFCRQTMHLNEGIRNSWIPPPSRTAFYGAQRSTRAAGRPSRRSSHRRFSEDSIWANLSVQITPNHLSLEEAAALHFSAHLISRQRKTILQRRNLILKRHPENLQQSGCDTVFTSLTRLDTFPRILTVLQQNHNGTAPRWDRSPSTSPPTAARSRATRSPPGSARHTQPAEGPWPAFPAKPSGR